MDQLPVDLGNFEPVDPVEYSEERLEKGRHNQAILHLEEEDLQWKLDARKLYSKCFTGLLFAQNAAVFTIIYFAYFQGKLEELSLILSVIISGTLVESAYLIRIIIQWLFSNSEYSVRQ